MLTRERAGPSAGTLLTDNLYQYNGNGNRILKRQMGGDTLYHYDPLNRLKKVEYPKGTEELFYDRAGNRIRRLAQGVEELYQYDPRNRLTSYTKNGLTTMFRYDSAGNLLADDKAFYSYDAFNRTTKVETFDGSIQINRYDAEGLRHEMEENGDLVRSIFNTDREVVTEQDSSSTNRLIRTTGLIARNTDSARTYYHYASDEMGSTTHIVDETGAVQNRYEYDAWGNLTAKEEQIPNRFTYYGQQLDPVTQQYYLRARFYNPVIGRFTQEDTYRGDGLNLYAYCASNPVYYVDPSGYDPDICKNLYKKIINASTAGNIEKLQNLPKSKRLEFQTYVEQRIRNMAETVAKEIQNPEFNHQVTLKSIKEIADALDLNTDKMAKLSKELQAYAYLAKGFDAKGRHPLLSISIKLGDDMISGKVNLYLSGTDNLSDVLGANSEIIQQIRKAKDPYHLLVHSERGYLFDNAPTLQNNELHFFIGLLDPCPKGCRPALRDLCLGNVRKPDGSFMTGIASEQYVVYLATMQEKMWMMLPIPKPEGAIRTDNVLQGVINLGNHSEDIIHRYYHINDDRNRNWRGTLIK